MSRFKTPVQITEQEGSEPPKFLVEGILPENALVTFQGAAKSGKSTLLFHMIKAMLSGEDFMGLKTQKISIVYFSEQSRSTLLDQLRKAGLDEIPENLYFCTSEDNWNLGWEKAFVLGGQMVREVNAKLLVYDSWGRFARFSSEENEMAPSATQERVTKLRGIQSDFKVCILLNQHTSKGSKGAGIVAAGLGSSALAQQVDLLLSLSGEPKVPDIGEDKLENPNCRALQGLGRFAPIKLAMELKDGKYVASQFVKSRRRNSWDQANSELTADTGTKQILSDAYDQHPEYDSMATREVAAVLNLSQSVVARFVKQRKLSLLESKDSGESR
jgi:hypothetical protein